MSIKLKRPIVKRHESLEVAEVYCYAKEKVKVLLVDANNKQLVDTPTFSSEGLVRAVFGTVEKFIAQSLDKDETPKKNNVSKLNPKGIKKSKPKEG